jgi:hypothetical protein
MNKPLIIAAAILIGTYESHADDTNTIPRDLAECKTAAIRVGDWDRDRWDASTATGQYLLNCMLAKGYRRREIDRSEAYIFKDGLPSYRSKEAEFLIRSGCWDRGNNYSIAIEECWQK